MAFLDIFSKKKEKTKEIKVIADHREKNSLVISELKNFGIKVEFEQLQVADFLVNDVAIERKTLSDFKSSIISKRIIRQLKDIKKYKKYFLMLEGLESDPYSGTIHENAFRGFMLSTALDYKVPIIFTLNEKDSARYISILAKKQPPKQSGMRASRTLLTEKEQMKFMLEGLPGVGPATAEKLLSHYKTIKNIFSSSYEELKSILGKKTDNIYKIITSEYK